MKKILMGYNFPKEHFTELEGRYEIIYPPERPFSREHIFGLIEDCEAFVPDFGLYTGRDIIDKGRKLKLIANFGVGYNNIDVAYALQKGITVSNLPESVREPTAELCFGLILATARQIGLCNNRLRTDASTGWGLYENPGLPVYGQTLGIVGMGRIGQAVARRAVASGMKIIYHNRRRLDKDIETKYQAAYVDLDSLCCQSDFISVNAPATPETRHIIGKKELGLMKSTAILINTSRGTLVDEKALAEALEQGKIWAAGLDVFEEEPYVTPGLFRMERVVLTPHIGTRTVKTRTDMQHELVRNIRGFFEGIYPVSKVLS
jgi:lactate dehydrogenase-like 2-hydroxyacid dehydrogenase